MRLIPSVRLAAVVAPHRQWATTPPETLRVGLGRSTLPALRRRNEWSAASAPADSANAQLEHSAPATVLEALPADAASKPTSPALVSTHGLRPPLVDRAAFHSMLFPSAESEADTLTLNEERRELLTDLNLDQIISSVIAGRDEYELRPIFLSPLKHIDAIKYRHDVMRDLSDASVLGCVYAFSKQMRQVRHFMHLSETLRQAWQKQRWFLDAVLCYCEALTALQSGLSQLRLESMGWQGFRGYLNAYCASEAFAAFTKRAHSLRESVDEVVCCIKIRAGEVTVTRYANQIDFSADVLSVFEKFKRADAKDYSASLRSSSELNHVEEWILDLVARLFPQPFLDIKAFFEESRDFINGKIRSFDRDIQFYVTYFEHMGRLKPFGLSFCYPRVLEDSKDVCANKTYDLALAQKLAGQKSTVVTNDLFLSGAERIFVVSGPNQGGKTTFARTFGQLHYLCELGLPVPGTEARLFLCDEIFTHFEKEEDVRNLRGKLQDDLVRIHKVLRAATPRSVIIMNEIFSSTTLNDALFLSEKVMRRIVELDALAVCVTFIDELTRFSAQTVSFVGEVAPGSQSARTFKLTRRTADGLSYALSLAERHGLTYEAIRRTIPS
jgi:DNA mismatch repair protein MutS